MAAARLATGSAPDASDDAVLRRVEDGVAWITLNRPEAGNAITAAMRDQVVTWLEEASADLARAGRGPDRGGGEGLLHRCRPPLPGPGPGPARRCAGTGRR